MSDDAPRSPRGSGPPAPDLKRQRDEFLQNFAKGARLTEDFVQEYERLRHRLRELEEENAELRTKVETGAAVRELLEKIRALESEKRELTSRFHQAEAVSSEFIQRFKQVESEFANLANLFVASSQLHSSLSPRGVMQRIKEVLAQLVGAERYCIYLANRDQTELVPIASEGVSGDELSNVRVEGTPIGEVFRRSDERIEESTPPSEGSIERPAAVFPLQIEDRTVGAVAVFTTVPQKTTFVAVDFELFRLIAQPAAPALVSASLFARAGQELPGLEAFLDLSV